MLRQDIEGGYVPPVDSVSLAYSSFGVHIYLRRLRAQHDCPLRLGIGLEKNR